MRTFRHPIAMFVAVVLVVIGIGVGVVAATSVGFPLGTVIGKFVEMGGAYPGGSVPLNGQVTLTSTTGATYRTAVNSEGEWAMQVAPGTYVARGFSPRWFGGRAPCTAGSPVRVGGGGSVSQVLIICPVV